MPLRMLSKMCWYGLSSLPVPDHRASISGRVLSTMPPLVGATQLVLYRGTGDGLVKGCGNASGEVSLVKDDCCPQLERCDRTLK